MLLKKNGPAGTGTPVERGRWVLAATILVALLSAGCAAPAPSTADGPTDAAPGLPRAGRNACPGSVRQVARQVGGAAADALEQLQGTYEKQPGFLGVVHDGRQPVIVVELRRLLEWQARMTPLGIAVARSCVDPGLLASVQAAVPRLSQGQDGIVSAGYDVLDDAISVLGVDPDVLMGTMDEIRRGSGSSALAAIEAGTLRINPARISDSR